MIMKLSVYNHNHFRYFWNSFSLADHGEAILSVTADRASNLCTKSILWLQLLQLLQFVRIHYASIDRRQIQSSEVCEVCEQREQFMNSERTNK